MVAELIPHQWKTLVTSKTTDFNEIEWGSTTMDPVTKGTTRNLETLTRSIPNGASLKGTSFQIIPMQEGRSGRGGQPLGDIRNHGPNQRPRNHRRRRPPGSRVPHRIEAGFFAGHAGIEQRPPKAQRAFRRHWRPPRPLRGTVHFFQWQGRRSTLRPDLG